LAASGFIRFRERLETEIAAAGPNPNSRLVGLGRGYVGFARAYPGLFRLMFRSERLNWSSPSLSQAGRAAFALLNQVDFGHAGQPDLTGPQALYLAMTRWSLIHGLSTLVIDGRLDGFVDLTEGADAETAIEEVLMRGLCPQQLMGSKPAK